MQSVNSCHKNDWRKVECTLNQNIVSEHFYIQHTFDCITQTFYSTFCKLAIHQPNMTVTNSFDDANTSANSINIYT